MKSSCELLRLGRLEDLLESFNGIIFKPISNKHYMCSRPSITLKTLFDLGELPWFLHFSNTPVPILFLCFLDAPEQRS